MSAARGIVAGAVLATVGLLAAGTLAGTLQTALRARDARLCALASYGTDRDIARCYEARGLVAPQNFNARTEGERVR